MQFYTTFISFLKQKTSLLLLVMALFCISGMHTSCSGPKTGCPINEKAGAKTNRKGELSNKRGKTNLFPKKVRKKMGGK